MYMSKYLNSNWTKHSYPNLKSFSLNHVHGPSERFERRNRKEFFNNNLQLIELHIVDDAAVDVVNIMDSLNGRLPNLQRLEVSHRYHLVNLVSTVIIIDKLESLTFFNGWKPSILGAISRGCKAKILKN